MRRKKGKSAEPVVDKKVRWVQKFIVFVQENGLSDFSMVELARIFEVSKATIYNHFRSKEELVYFMTVHIINRLSYYRVILHDSNLTYLERYFLAFLDFSGKANLLGQKLLYELRTNFPQCFELMVNFREGVKEDLIQFYSEGLELEYISGLNPRVAAASDLLFFILLYDREYLGYENTLSNEELFKEYFYSRFHGMLKLNMENAMRQQVLKLTGAR